MGIMETRIRVDNTTILSRFDKFWKVESNAGLARNIRVVIIWKEAIMAVDVLYKEAQFIHCHVR